MCLVGPQEIDRKMSRCLVDRILPDTHSFDDVMKIYGEPMHILNAFKSRSEYEDKLELAFSLPCHDTAWCSTHHGYCQFQTGGSSRVGGFPCVDFSTAGKQLKIDGPQLPTCFAFGAKARHTRSPCIGVENVVGCPDHLVPDAFGADFQWRIHGHMNPDMFGFDFISRPRTDQVPRNLTVHEDKNDKKVGILHPSGTIEKYTCMCKFRNKRTSPWTTTLPETFQTFPFSQDVHGRLQHPFLFGNPFCWSIAGVCEALSSERPSTNVKGSILQYCIAS